MILYSGIVIEPEKHQVRVCGREANLMLKHSMQMLVLLTKEPGRVYTYEYIGMKLKLSSRVRNRVEVVVKRLRIELFPDDTELSKIVIQHVEGLGYRVPTVSQLHQHLDDLMDKRREG